MTQREEKKGVQLEVVMRRIAPHLQEIYPGLLGVSPSYPFTFIIFFFSPPISLPLCLLVCVWIGF